MTNQMKPLNLTFTIFKKTTRTIVPKIFKSSKFRLMPLKTPFKTIASPLATMPQTHTMSTTIMRLTKEGASLLLKIPDF